MIQEIQAKVLLAHVHQPEPWFGLKYNMNIYRGCQHQCIYCDSRSECYQIENFKDVLVKVNAIDLLRKELPRKRVKGTIGTGSMSDPYLPLEGQRRHNGPGILMCNHVKMAHKGGEVGRIGIVHLRTWSCTFLALLYNPAIAFCTASTVWAITFSVCTVDMKTASNCDGAR
jgi:hypothetical protein